MSTQALAFFVIAYRQKKDLLCNNYIASNRTFSTILNGVRDFLPFKQGAEIIALDSRKMYK